MVAIFKATCILLTVGISLLFRHLFLDWKRVRQTDTYINNTTPWSKLTYNAIFYGISSLFIISAVFFIYLALSKIEITPPF